MTIRIAIRALAVWAIILVLAIANGILREAVLIPAFGPTPGLSLSGILLCGLIFATAYLSLSWLAVRTTRKLLLIGLCWLLLTVTFEFSFGLIRGMPLSAILAAYSFQGGNLWPMVLIVTAVAPWLAAKAKGVAGDTTT